MIYNVREILTFIRGCHSQLELTTWLNASFVHITQGLKKFPDPAIEFIGFFDHDHVTRTIDDYYSGTCNLLGQEASVLRRGHHIVTAAKGGRKR